VRTPFTRRALLAAAGAAALLGCAAAAHAQSFPAKPVHLIVTYPPGGSSDLMARIMGEKLGDVWKQPVIIENRPGAAGSIGMDYAARQPGDGYTFVIGNLGPALVNPIIQKVPYSMDKDFVPVSLVATGPNILVVPMASPYKTLADLVTAARAKPGVISFGTSGPGSMSHLSGELLIRQAGIKLNAVPYKGGILAVNDVVAGHLDMIVSDALPVSQFIKANRVRPLAITSDKRSRLFPDIPTFNEGGVPGLVADNWWGVYVPTGTPASVVAAYQQALAKVMAEPDVKEKFAQLGVEAMATSPAEFRSFLAAEHAKYSKLVADNGIKGE
jgi:tripartite-type tricarboxylate transporter receptor subunit TctC